MHDYLGFKYWPVSTTANVSLWRIQFPGGHKTPPIPFASEDDVKAAIDGIIASFTTKKT